MKRTFFCLYLLVIIFFVFIVSNIAFATNWIYVGRDASRQPVKGDVFIDSDTVVRNGETIFFWGLWFYDAPFQLTISSSLCQKRLSKFQVKLLNPHMSRILETYFYDSNNKEIYRDITLGGWLKTGSVGDNLINTVLRYAKQGQATGQKPTPYLERQLGY